MNRTIFALLYCFSAALFAANGWSNTVVIDRLTWEDSDYNTIKHVDERHCNDIGMRLPTATELSQLSSAINAHGQLLRYIAKGYYFSSTGTEGGGYEVVPFLGYQCSSKDCDIFVRCVSDKINIPEKQSIHQEKVTIGVPSNEYVTERVYAEPSVVYAYPYGVYAPYYYGYYAPYWWPYPWFAGVDYHYSSGHYYGGNGGGHGHGSGHGSRPSGGGKIHR